MIVFKLGFSIGGLSAFLSLIGLTLSVSSSLELFNEASICSHYLLDPTIKAAEVRAFYQSRLPDPRQLAIIERTCTTEDKKAVRDFAQCMFSTICLGNNEGRGEICGYGPTGLSGDCQEALDRPKPTYPG